jgi:hypothetical protein
VPANSAKASTAWMSWDRAPTLPSMRPKNSNSCSASGTRASASGLGYSRLSDVAANSPTLGSKPCSNSGKLGIPLCLDRCPPHSAVVARGCLRRTSH